MEIIHQPLNGLFTLICAGKHGEHALHGTLGRVAVRSSKGKPNRLTSYVVETFGDKDDDAYVMQLHVDTAGPQSKAMPEPKDLSETGLQTSAPPEDKTDRM